MIIIKYHSAFLQRVLQGTVMTYAFGRLCWALSSVSTLLSWFLQVSYLLCKVTFIYCTLIILTSLVVPGSIPGSTMGIFPEGDESRGDHGLGRLVEFRFKGPPGTTSSYITTHIIGTT